MTIVQCKQPVSGVMLDGWRISCHTCHGTNFFQDRKHLPHLVVWNHFRDRGWQVNSSTKDKCPSCIQNKRQGKPKADPKLQSRETENLDTEALKKCIARTGLRITAVTELVSTKRKFKISLLSWQVNIGQLKAAETEVVLSFGAKRSEGYLKPEMITHTDKGVLELVQHWYLTLDMEKRDMQIAAE